MIIRTPNSNSECEKLMKKCEREAKLYSNRKQIKKPSMLEKLQRNRYQARSVYYFTCERLLDSKLLNEENTKKKSPYYFPKSSNDFSCLAEYKEERAALREKAKLYKYYNRPNHRSRQNENKLERLFVSTSDMELPGKSITDDINAQFFTVVSDSPIKEKLDIKSYLRDLQSLFLIRLQIGHKHDEMYLMDEMHREEKKRLAEIRKRFDIYAECYDKFLSEDHVSSLDLLKAADEESKKSKMKREKIKQLHRDCGWYRTKILILDEQWRIARIFQKFLYQISPLWWRKEYDFMYKSKDSSEPSDSLLFDKQTSSNLTTAPSIITIIDQFIEEIGKVEPPKLYFEDPNELLQIFYELERNNLLALLQCEEITQPAEQMMSGLKKAQQLFKDEVNILREHLKFLEEEVIFEETRSRECEEKAKSISFGLFKDLIVDKYTLNLYVNVEDCYEACVAPNDSNLPLLMMMKGIEYQQESLMSALDNLPSDIMLKGLQACYKEDARIMKEAYEATKIMVQIDNLMKTLRKSLEPRREAKKGRKLLWRSEPPVEKMEMKVQGNFLTKEQLEYLHFFTDFCAATDDPEVGKLLWHQRISGTITTQGLCFWWQYNKLFSPIANRKIMINFLHFPPNSAI